ncbi:hypothetical protein NPIL_322491 [Nephila pilipes]|uniref:Uncharacterized protein n=1 Tax=Nephila pilipes TaxID=299642 RepID=A0A8X6T8R2_NEPPI|nr:hypothetical protein NPIL_322491 [Nephila pilipes]
MCSSVYIMEHAFAVDLIRFLMERRGVPWKFHKYFLNKKNSTLLTQEIQNFASYYLDKEETNIYFLYMTLTKGLEVNNDTFCYIADYLRKSIFKSVDKSTDLIRYLTLMGQCSLLAYQGGAHLAPLIALREMHEAMKIYIPYKEELSIIFWAALHLEFSSQQDQLQNAKDVGAAGSDPGRACKRGAAGSDPGRACKRGAAGSGGAGERNTTGSFGAGEKSAAGSGRVGERGCATRPGRVGERGCATRPGRVGERGCATRPGGVGERGCATRPGGVGERGCATRPGGVGERGCATRPGGVGERGCATRPGGVGERGCATRPGRVGERGCATRPGRVGEKGCATKPDRDCERGCATRQDQKDNKRFDGKQEKY